MEPVRARAEADLLGRGVKIGVVGDGYHLVWPLVTARKVTDLAVQPSDDMWLRLPDDVARAIYTALAEYYGHGANDVRTLRKDYEAERTRVDRFINFLTDPHQPNSMEN